MHTSPYLVIHSGYHGVHIGVYDGTRMLGEQSIDKKLASSLLMQTILDILTQHLLHMHDLLFIGVHAGPAPFTTLRVGITTANGIGFASKLPLIPVNGLELLSNLYPEYTVLLNAFCEDVYVGKQGATSCENIDLFLEKELARTHSTPLFELRSGRAAEQPSAHLEYPTKLQAETGVSRECKIHAANHLYWQRRATISRENSGCTGQQSKNFS